MAVIQAAGWSSVHCGLQRGSAAYSSYSALTYGYAFAYSGKDLFATNFLSMLLLVSESTEVTSMADRPFCLRVKMQCAGGTTTAD